MEWMDLLRKGQLDKLTRQEPDPAERYARVVINFADAGYQGKNVEIQVSGDYLSKAKYTGNVGDAEIKLNHRHSQGVVVAEFRKTYAVYKKLYLSSTDTSGQLVLYVGGAFAGEIEPSTGQDVGLLNTAGAEINPVRDERFMAHAGGHVKKTLAVDSTTERLVAASLKVRWAIIGVEDFDARWGFSSTVATVAAIGIKVAAGSFITVENCDLYELYFVNASGGAAELPVMQVEYMVEA